MFGWLPDAQVQIGHCHAVLREALASELGYAVRAAPCTLPKERVGAYVDAVICMSFA